ncbi:IS66 family insertion sequence element accessory protein TnpB [Vibrio alginolyticus]|uniref:IS66 family insertion sequence element accessory protein TnpB n=1 Tax=Vibrio sp. Vb1729 TaxID=3074644 RepID=UPI0029F91C93|nr:hypothetical protein [Vibrio alginolyticus]EJL6749799.1 IS66 family insertion sequence element accessory protein TnpB [Vibrio alginolyticus]EMA9138548.1 IS66 family insertion sequence element accessory protein TnpB [Vibrio alginolyticus]
MFGNRGRDKLNIIQWDTNEFRFHYRRLEKGRFKWPTRPKDTVALEVTARQLRWVLGGLNWQNAVAQSCESV